jgi:hypothetical protein
MPVKKTKITKGPNKGKVRVSTPGGVKAKAATPANAAAQERLLNAIEHNPKFKPRNNKKKSAKKGKK